MPFYTLIFYMLSFPVLLFSQIETVRVSWTPGLCPDTCVIELTRQLRGLPQVKDAGVNEASASATILWQPNQPFSFNILNQTFRFVGIRIQSTRLQAKGTPELSGGSAYLISSGDFTRIRLLGPIRPDPNRYVIRANIENHPLPDSLVEQLAEAKKLSRQVVVEGPLFAPERLPFPALIIESLKIEKEKK